MALFLGSTSLDIPIYESICNTTGGGAPGTLTKTTTGYSRMADDLAAHLGAAGPCFTFTTACTSSANALLYATEMIQTRRIRLAMVVGFEALSRLSLYGFESLGLIAGDAAAPFGVRSGGMVLGEGCGALVLDGRSAGRTGFALLGGANRCDPHGVTTHAENGSAMAEVMRDAMASAGVNREEITAVKVHATGNVANDRAEFKGLKTVFGAEIPPLTGLKPYVGHTLGACGAVEMIVLAEAVADGFIPASPRDPPADQKVPAFLTDHIIAVGQGAFLINHFGFGGSCTAFITANGK
jgi:3-oxoacyl-[acyl-carrier-protein] synthase-1